MKIIDFWSSEGQLWAQICFEEAPKLRKKELEGAESKLRETKYSKMLSRELQEAAEEAPSHDLSTLPNDYKHPWNYGHHRPSVGGAAAQLRPPFDEPNICRRRGPPKAS